MFLIRHRDHWFLFSETGDLILARLLGFRGELSPRQVESLVPRAARRLSLDQFLRSLQRFDAEWERRVGAAAARGRVLRYVAAVTRRSLVVELRGVDRSSRMG